jgi:hypothetical protein
MRPQHPPPTSASSLPTPRPWIRVTTVVVTRSRGHPRNDPIPSGPDQIREAPDLTLLSNHRSSANTTRQTLPPSPTRRRLNTCCSSGAPSRQGLHSAAASKAEIQPCRLQAAPTRHPASPPLLPPCRSSTRHSADRQSPPQPHAASHPPPSHPRDDPPLHEGGSSGAPPSPPPSTAKRGCHRRRQRPGKEDRAPLVS